ncbi:MAG: hypothetical protein MZV64_13915 [Ignavibacteriales bacterium]|nr:hypothetical protein [Ignavibacteriales bacterium]
MGPRVAGGSATRRAGRPAARAGGRRLHPTTRTWRGRWTRASMDYAGDVAALMNAGAFAAARCADADGVRGLRRAAPCTRARERTAARRHARHGRHGRRAGAVAPVTLGTARPRRPAAVAAEMRPKLVGPTTGRRDARRCSRRSTVLMASATASGHRLCGRPGCQPAEHAERRRPRSGSRRRRRAPVL